MKCADEMTDEERREATIRLEKWQPVVEKLLKELTDVLNKHVSQAQADGCDCCYAVEAHAATLFLASALGHRIADENLNEEEIRFLFENTCNQLLNDALDHATIRRGKDESKLN